MSRHESRQEVDYTLPVTITRLGHDPIIPHGTVIKCVCANDVNLYDELDSETDRLYPFPAERRVTMKEAGVGLVLDHRFHVCPLELVRARLRFSEKKHHLEDVYEHLWYCIMFRKGHFWARYNWVEVVTHPVDVESARAFSQGPPPG